MILDGVRPQFISDFATDGEELNQLYKLVTDCAVRKVLKLRFPKAFDGDDLLPEKLEDPFHKALPLFTHTEVGEVPCNFSFYLITRYRTNAFKFFFEMISNWLVPGHRLDVKQFYAVDFRIRDFDEGKYTLTHIMLRLQSQWEKEQVEINLPLITSEIHLGVSSAYYARRILETKGLSSDQKTACIQEDIAWVLARRPHEMDRDVFSEMQHMLVLCPDSFKRDRESRHLSKLISLKYLFRRHLKRLVREKPAQRHLGLKMYPVRVRRAGKQVPCLGVVVAVNFLSEKEVFEERHLLRAIQNHMPDVSAVEGSFISIRRAGDKVATFYMEVEKPEEKPFHRDEIERLTGDLQDDLKDRVERLLQPVFMPRNEEEIMRNILSLSHQVKYLRDIPQVFITFDEQTYSHLFFTIIHVAARKEGDPSLEEIFKQADTFLEFLHDFTKNVGFLRKKYPKEATVFRVKLPKEMFLRDDHSIDLYKARQVVVGELERVLGHLRDFNGGMIAKQNELLCKLRALLAEEGVYNDLLLENFFYSLMPANMRSIFEAEKLKALFLMLLDTMNKGFLPGKSYTLAIRRDLDVVYAAVVAETPELKERLSETLKRLNNAPSELGSVFLSSSGAYLMGYLYRSDDPYKQEHFCQLVSHQVKI